MAAEFLAFLLLAQQQQLPPLSETEVREIVALCEAPNSCDDKAEEEIAPAGGSAPEAEFAPIFGGSAPTAEAMTADVADSAESESVVAESVDLSESAVSEVVASEEVSLSEAAEPRIRTEDNAGDRAFSLRETDRLDGAARIEPRRVYRARRAPVARAAPVVMAPPPPPVGSGARHCMLLEEARTLARREVPRLFGREGLQFDGAPIESAAKAHYIGRRTLSDNYLVSIDFNALPKVPPGTQPCRAQVAAVLVRRVPPNPAVHQRDEVALRLQGQLAAKLDP